MPEFDTPPGDDIELMIRKEVEAKFKSIDRESLEIKEEGNIRTHIAKATNNDLVKVYRYERIDDPLNVEYGVQIGTLKASSANYSGAELREFYDEFKKDSISHNFQNAPSEFHRTEGAIIVEGELKKLKEKKENTPGQFTLKDRNLQKQLEHWANDIGIDPHKIKEFSSKPELGQLNKKGDGNVKMAAPPNEDPELIAARLEAAEKKAFEKRERLKSSLDSSIKRSGTELKFVDAAFKAMNSSLNKADKLLGELKDTKLPEKITEGYKHLKFDENNKLKPKGFMLFNSKAYDIEFKDYMNKMDPENLNETVENLSNAIKESKDKNRNIENSVGQFVREKEQLQKSYNQNTARLSNDIDGIKDKLKNGALQLSDLEGFQERLNDHTIGMDREKNVTQDTSSSLKL